MEKEENTEAEFEQTASAQEVEELGKFKSVGALKRAYEQLEAEFTRRSQRLKALEEAQAEGQVQQTPQPETEEERAENLYRAINENEGVRARVVSDYLASLKGVPLMAGGGVGVTAPKARAKSIAEAGELALGYFRNQNKN